MPNKTTDYVEIAPGEVTNKDQLWHRVDDLQGSARTTKMSQTTLEQISGANRKNGVDSVAFSATPSFDFDAGNYDNKEITLTGNITEFSLVATRQTYYELRFRQDGVGNRTVLANTATSLLIPNLPEILIDPTPGSVTVLRLYYDGVNFNWG